MPIARFLAKRLAAMILILLVISVLLFSLLDLAPGSVVATLLGNQPATPETIAAIQTRYHLNDPFWAQYWHWLSAALHGDLGRSIQSDATVTSTIGSALPITATLAVYTMVLVLLIGIPLGMLAGITKRRFLDRSISAFAAIGLSAPGFVIGIVLIYVFGVKLGWFPVYGAGNSGLIDRIAHLTLPAIALATGLSAFIIRQTRAAALNVMDEDFIAFARSRGLSRSRIMLAYALRNISLPIVTAAGLLIIAAVSGTVLIETVFSVPGVGSLMVKSINAKDIPVVQGLALFVALIVVVTNLLTDTAVMIIDPRARISVRR